MSDHTPGEQERDSLEVWSCQGCGRIGRSMRDLLGQGCEGKPERFVAEAEREDVTENYMVAVSRLKAERDSLQAQVDEAREALRGLVDSIYEDKDGWWVPGETEIVVARNVLARSSPPTEGT